MKYLYVYFLIIFNFSLFGQNTVGTIINEIGSYNGYTLFTANHSGETYLINNCGEIVNQWSSTNKPGVAVYLLENGNLLRTAKINNTNITFGGVGGKIELFDWDDNLLWEYTYSSSTATQHHDVFPLPNGNILMLAATTMTEAEAIQAGRDSAKLTEGKLYNEQILELEPVGANQANIVWEWNIKDHLIQDIDNTKSNFGVIADNPQLLNINYLSGGNPGEANWLHVNSIQYNASLDQIMLSSRFMNEIYIIDHSTSTLEASQHSGGTYGKGGDFLYRWGNPEAYNHGDTTNKQLFGQHYPHWIAEGLTDAGKILIFNNGAKRGNTGDEYFSSLDIIDPLESSPGSYIYDPINGYGPSVAEWSYTKPVKEDFYSPILSSGQRLPNGNTLICVGFFGRFFEIDPSNNIVWEYTNPDTSSGGTQVIQTQGQLPTALGSVFRVLRYSTDYKAFKGRDLTPKGTIENGNDLGNCEVLNNKEFQLVDLKVFPNPIENVVNIETTTLINKVEIYNTLGQFVTKGVNSNKIYLNNLTKGLYVMKIYTNYGYVNKKIIKN
ncbi:aryl-sulfate sulfotransferase [Flavivirga rizhaonensis]|uniref:T9SS type A sorting domain-containing protein n=1 Tax=Flavivirga rizhaonensis TaxID=2559571 RepID=A0A4V3P4N0_9FLAO|nr:aryl-sulfate sulfotransferase [Flavivirga rizhaonensis]TGV02044.1 T9SS type A sorting domain-containing protein [Flavivirga rizhaonensis]